MLYLCFDCSHKRLKGIKSEKLFHPIIGMYECKHSLHILIKKFTAMQILLIKVQEFIILNYY